MMSRRTFIAAGIAGSAALAAAYWWRSAHDASSAGAFAADADAIVAAIVPAMLDGVLPTQGDARAAAIAATVAGVHTAIEGLPIASRHELDQLFALLAFAPARIALARVSSPWSHAAADDVAAFLDRWRTSRLQLLRSAYDALHQLVFAAWYGQPASWPAIGYAGPPKLE